MRKQHKLQTHHAARSQTAGFLFATKIGQSSVLSSAEMHKDTRDEFYSTVC